ncbi:MAG: glutamate-5-semialdehyde dehydrogenase, partial [Ilumatobacteraceae bacterium]
MTGGQRLDALQPGQLIPFGGDRAIAVPQELADSFVAGDRLVVLQDSGVLLHIPAREHAVVDTAVERAHHAFIELAAVTDEQISTFYASFADLLADDGVFGAIAAANEADVVSARSRGRTTTRLELSPAMRLGMIEGLRMWRDSPSRRDAIIESIEHSGWSVTAR